MSEDTQSQDSGGIAKRLFKVVGKAGSAVGDVAGGLIRSAGRSARNAGGRASLTFASEVEQTPPKVCRELAESLTRWLVQEHQGRADLQRQKPSTVELSEMNQASTFYEVMLEEPGLAGRRFRFVVRHHPLPEIGDNFPDQGEAYHEEALLVLAWPQSLSCEVNERGIAIWDQASIIGRRNPATDLIQQWLLAELGGTFVYKKVQAKKRPKAAKPMPLWGREEELQYALRLILTPRPRELKSKNLISLAAPGGTGKSYFLKALRQSVGHRVKWAGVDHQGMADDSSGLGLLGRCLAKLARELEEQSVEMDGFRKEFRSFQKRVEAAEKNEPSGFFSHLRKAAMSTAGVNPILGAVSAGVVFLTSWGQEMKEESEALAQDNAVKALTSAFQKDLLEYSEQASAEALCWLRPVLVFDTYEWLAPMIDTWLRTELLAEEFLEKSRLVIVLSGREHLLRTDTRWAEWQHQTASISLAQFDRATSDSYLSSLGVGEDRMSQLYDFTEGLPLFLTLAAQIEEADQAVHILADRVLEEVPQEWGQDFLKAALLDEFSDSNLRRLFSEKSQEELAQLAKLLSGATFTLAQDGKRAFLPPVRKVFRRRLLLDIGESSLKDLQSRLV